SRVAPRGAERGVGVLKRTRRQTKSSDFNVSSEMLATEIENWVHEDRRRLGEILLDDGVIVADQLLDALERQQLDGGRLGDILLEEGLVDEHQLAAALSEQFQIPLADLRVEEPEQAAIDIVGEELARKHNVMPLRVEDDGRVAL